jgi:adenylate cyclase
MNKAEFQTTIDWMIDGARSAPGPNQLMAEACERGVRAGLPLWRVAVFVSTLHPDLYGVAFYWRSCTDVVVNNADFDPRETQQFRDSPLAILYEKGQEVRYRLDDPESRRFPFFDEMRAEGVTDYIALPLVFIEGSIHASSWSTREPGGFSDEHLDALRSLVRPLARLVEIINLRRTATTLLDTYVGNRAGERIWGGQIRRGHADTMQAAIWLSDLRGFTALSDRLQPETVVEILNRYFDCQVPAIRKHGGEIPATRWWCDRDNLRNRQVARAKQGDPCAERTSGEP